ncbi:MAG: response regulator [Phenylobacterium sp.]|nr:MAG: response regulator [Phenylobacterium sp.]
MRQSLGTSRRRLVLHFERDRPRILVVDDDPMVPDIVTTRLSLAGCTTYSARDGLAAVERIREVRPVAMVLDINMPGLDGFGVLKHMKITGSIRSIATLELC